MGQLTVLGKYRLLIVKCEGRINTVSERSSAYSTISHPPVYLRCVRMPWSVCPIKTRLKSWLVYKCIYAALIEHAHCNVQTHLPHNWCSSPHGGNPPPQQLLGLYLFSRKIKTLKQNWKRRLRLVDPGMSFQNFSPPLGPALRYGDKSLCRSHSDNLLE
jgi:hypothetical protein